MHKICNCRPAYQTNNSFFNNHTNNLIIKPIIIIICNDHKCRSLLHPTLRSPRLLLSISFSVKGVRGSHNLPRNPPGLGPIFYSFFLCFNISIYTYFLILSHPLYFVKKTTLLFFIFILLQNQVEKCSIILFN